MNDYQPSLQLTTALADFAQAEAAAEAARARLRAAVAEELMTYDVTADGLAPHVPWSGETVRGIAREYDVPRRRKPTVKSIKPARPKPTGRTRG